MSKDKPQVPRPSIEQKGYQPSTGPGKALGGFQAPTSNNVPSNPPNEGTSGTKK